MPRSIPDRWKDYKPIGKRIEGTRFIAFKVPLKEYVLKHLDSETHLDGNLLLEMIPNLGLIIDLTNTNRYYDPKIFQKKGIEHKKLMIPGRETPSKDLSNKFIMIVKEFLDKNKDNDKLIGVHCTHGVNRTGFMICNYMITQMTIEPNEALDKFVNARGHNIERNNYINNLQNLQETKKQNVTAKQKAEPKNWRERKVNNVQPENWRQPGQKLAQRIENDHKEVSNRYQVLGDRRNDSRSKSPLSRTHYRRGRSDSFSRQRTTDIVNERPRYIVPPAEARKEQLRYPKSVSHQTSNLRLDYYNKRPVDKSQHKRDLLRNYLRPTRHS